MLHKFNNFDEIYFSSWTNIWLDKNEDFCQEGNLSQRLSSPSSHFRTWFIGLEEKRNETQTVKIF